MKLRADSPEINNRHYQKFIGALLYIAVNTRPDIAAPISILSQYIKAPKKVDWIELKRVGRYLKHTMDYELKLSNSNKSNMTLVGFADANWAEDHEDRKSNSGYIFRLNGGAVSWACRKQACIALSSTEAEIVALAETCREAAWIRRLLKDFNELQKTPTIIYEDNQSCINRLKNGSCTTRTKHMDTKYFYTKDLKSSGEVDIVYCPSERNEADMLTKPIGAIKLKGLCKKIGLGP